MTKARPFATRLPWGTVEKRRRASPLTPLHDLHQVAGHGGLLSRRPRLHGEGGVDSEVLSLTDTATTEWCAFVDDMERDLLADGLSSSIRGLRNKYPEMVFRLAGVLAAVDGEGHINPNNPYERLPVGVALSIHHVALGEAGREAPGKKFEGLLGNRSNSPNSADVGLLS